MFIRLINKINGKVIQSKELINIDLVKNGNVILDTESYKSTFEENESFEVYIVGIDSDFKKSTKMRRAQRKLILNLAEVIFETTSKTISEVRHSLGKYSTDLNLNILELIPQDLSYQKKENSIVGVIKKIIENDVDRVSKKLQKIRKLSAMMNNEILVMKAIQRDDVEIKKNTHNIKNVVLYIYHLFETDFKKKDVEVRVEIPDVNLKIEYNLFQGILVPVFDNCFKYSKPGSKITVNLVENLKTFEIVINMTSLCPSEEEKQHIFDYNFRAENAKLYPGDGIGLYTVSSIAKILNGNVELVFGQKIESEKNINYSNNVFKIRLPK